MHYLSRRRDASFFELNTCNIILFQVMTRAEYELNGCMVVNIKRELEFKISVMAGLQDINAMYKTKGAP